MHTLGVFLYGGVKAGRLRKAIKRETFPGRGKVGARRWVVDDAFSESFLRCVDDALERFLRCVVDVAYVALGPFKVAESYNF